MHMMTMPATTVIPDLRVSNDLLGDRAALETEWERSGYWFFRNAVPIEALEEFRRPILESLKTIGAIDDNATEPVWNGSSLDRFPKANLAGYDALPGLTKSRRWIDFLARPDVASFFQKALGAEANWIAVAELRVVPPGEDLGGGLFTYPHQDGFYNEGYRCLTAWMPLWPVAKAAGGLAVAEGMHRNGYFHDKTQPPPSPIPPGAIPEDAWRTADYEPGDVVMFDRVLPHSGQRNRTKDYFRVSFDVRCILPGDPVPLFGNVASISDDKLEVCDLEGVLHKFRLSEKSQVRGTSRSGVTTVRRDQVKDEYPAGQEVLVTSDGDEVIMLREPKY